MMEDEEELVTEKELTTKSNLSIVKEEENNIVTQIAETNNGEDLNNYVNAFNANLVKRQVIRSEALNDVQDELVMQMLRRLQDQPDNFDNVTLANWTKTVQQVLDSNQNNINKINEMPQITQIQNTQINVNFDNSIKSKESSEKILDAIKTIIGEENLKTTIDAKFEPEENFWDDDDNLDDDFEEEELEEFTEDDFEDPIDIDLDEEVIEEENMGRSDDIEKTTRRIF